MDVAAVPVHHEDLVALEAVALRLKDQLLAVGRPVRLGVFSAERELADVGQVNLARVAQGDLLSENGEGARERAERIVVASRVHQVGLKKRRAMPAGIGAFGPGLVVVLNLRGRPFDDEASAVRWRAPS